MNSSLKIRTKSVLRKALPAPVIQVGSRLLDEILPGRRATLRRWKVQQHIRTATKDVVAAGPFKGLRYTPATSWGGITPLLVGSYEAELHEILEEVIASAPSVIIDVGSAEGYYANGLARRLPESTVYAFDPDPRARQLCREMALLNGLTNVEIEGSCTHRRLSELSGKRTFLLIDCEGCEETLLDPGLVPNLSVTTMVTELHDFIDPSISRKIISRFSQTHHIEVVDCIKRDLSRWSVLNGLNYAERSEAVNEHRPVHPYPMRWAVMRPLGL